MKSIAKIFVAVAIPTFWIPNLVQAAEPIRHDAELRNIAESNQFITRLTESASAFL